MRGEVEIFLVVFASSFFLLVNIFFCPLSISPFLYVTYNKWTKYSQWERKTTDRSEAQATNEPLRLECALDSMNDFSFSISVYAPFVLPWYRCVCVRYSSVHAIATGFDESN